MSRSGKTLLIIVGLVALLLYFTLHEPQRCPDHLDVWVMSDSRWVCVRPTYVP